MNWYDKYLPEAREDIHKLDGSQRKLVRKAIEKVKKSPLPADEGGYGKPLGHKQGTNLTSFLKVKLRASGLRIVYKLERSESSFLVVIVGVRADEEVYKEAQSRVKKHGLL